MEVGSFDAESTFINFGRETGLPEESRMNTINELAGRASIKPCVVTEHQHLKIMQWVSMVLSQSLGRSRILHLVYVLVF